MVSMDLSISSTEVDTCCSCFPCINIKHLKVGRMLNWAACVGNNGMLLKKISRTCSDDTHKSLSNLSLSLSNLSDLFSLWKKS
jgi:hypothetical protein